MLVNQMNREQLLHWIDMVSFAVVDMTEYLDTHPKDEEAIKYFNYYSEQRKMALCAYAQKYGPLTLDTAMPQAAFDWANEMLPWEGRSC